MFKDLLFPKFCIGCGFIGTYICLRCEKMLFQKSQDTCLYCERASPYGLTHPGCRREYGIDASLSCFYYNTLLKKIIATCKYKLARDVFGEFRSVLPLTFLYKLSFFRAYPLKLQAVPLHPARQRLRGFNHADSIGSLFLPYLSNTTRVDHLRRRIHTTPQAHLSSASDRYRNVRNAFECRDEKAIGGYYMLIDDIVTSGNTVKEACKTLKRAGADKVFVLTLAAG